MTQPTENKEPHPIQIDTSWRKTAPPDAAQNWQVGGRTNRAVARFSRTTGEIARPPQPGRCYGDRAKNVVGRGDESDYRLLVTAEPARAVLRPPKKPVRSWSSETLTR